VPAVGYSPDGRRLASASLDRTVKVWDAATGTELYTLRGHTAAVVAVAFSEDGRNLVSAAADHTVKEWVGEVCRQTRRLGGHGEPAVSLSLNRDGKRLVSASQKRVKVWNTETGEEVPALEDSAEEPFNGNTEDVHALAISPDGRRLASPDRARIKVWDMASGSELFTLAGHFDWLTHVCYSPDGKYLASGSLDRTAKVWDAGSGKELLTLTGHTGPVRTVSFSPDNRQLASAADDETVRVWEVATGRELYHCPGDSAVCFNPTGQHLARAHKDVVKIWSAATGEEYLTLKGHNGSVRAVHYSPDGKRLVSAAADKTVKVWDAVTGAELLTLKRRDNYVTPLCFSPDGRRLATPDTDDVFLWDTDLENGAPNASQSGATQDQALEVRRALVFHEDQAREAERGSDWFAAVFHRRELAKLQPDQAEALSRLGAARMEFGQQPQAAADFAAALKRDPNDSIALRWQARLCLEAGDRDGYHRACVALLKAHGQTKDLEVAHAIVETCTLSAGAVPDFEAVLRLAREVAAARKDDSFAQTTLSAALLRAGRHREAAERLRKAHEERARDQPPREELLLAIAEHHLGQAAEARRSLEEAVAWLDREQSLPRATMSVGVGAATPLDVLPALRGQEYDPLLPRLGWSACLELRLLRREAENLIGRLP
jgi:WD40 repeat protein/Flp pilus assembly protein TadD